MTRFKGSSSNFFAQWVAFGVAGVTLTLTVAFGMYQDHEAAKAYHQSRLIAMTHVLEVAIEQNFASVSDSLADVRDAMSVNELTGKALNFHLQTIVRAMPMVRTMFVVDASGKMQAASRPELLEIDRNYSDRNYFQVPMAQPNVDTLYISTPFRTVLDTYTIALTRVIRGSNGEFFGVVSAIIDPVYFDQLLESVRYAPDLIAALNDQEGTVFLIAPHTPEKKVLLGVNLAKPGAFFTQHRDSGRTLSVFSGAARATGDDRLVVVRDIQPAALHMDKSISVATSRLLSEVYASWREDELVEAGLVILALSFSALALYAYQRRNRAFLDNEALLQLAVDSMHEAFLLYDKDGKIIRSNANVERITGLSQSQLKGLTPIDPRRRIIHDDGSDYEVADRPFNVSLHHGISLHQVSAGICSEAGKVTWILVNSSPVGDPQNPTGAVVTFVDVTEQRSAEAHLKASELRLRLATEMADIAVWEMNLEKNEMSRTANHDSLYGLPWQAVWHTETFLNATHPDHRERANQVIMESLVSGGPDQYAFDFPVVWPNGEVHWLWVKGEVVRRDAAGRGQALRGVLSDVTSRKLSEDRLQLAASVFAHASEGITVTDVDGTIVDVNDMFTEITGYGRDEVLGQNPRVLQSGRQDKAFYAAMWRELVDRGQWSGEVWNRRKNGDVYAQSLTITTVRNEHGVTTNYVGLFADITDRKSHQAELEHIAHYDALTKLPNRLLLGDRLQHAIAQSQRRNKVLAIVYLDLDNIKAVNDIHGHDAGDAVLIAVCEAMKEALREGDTLARIGGDEFVAVLTDMDQSDDGIPVVERLLKAAATPVQLLPHGEPGGIDIGISEADYSVQVSASIGITFFPHDNVDADVLLRHADQAMYQAKQSGKNRYHLFDIAHDAETQSRYEEIKHIRNALENNEFVLYYQPKVNMRVGEVVGAEALIRWQHPERGLLKPVAFLPTIEDHPLSIELGEWVIGTALAQMATWHSQGLELSVSVNIGALQLQQADFVSSLGALLTSHSEVNPKRLQLEILETSALNDMHKVAAVMRACQTMDVAFALDDFGTGYASLSYLKHLPAEVLKIDQTFIRNMTSNPDDLAIVKGVIGLAQVFRRQVIAEGVETKAHGDLLLGIGCEMVQGYGIARPMPPGELPAWIAKWQLEANWTA